MDFAAYRRSGSRRPLLLQGEAAQVLAGLPEGSIDCCMTSPPYWGKREYAGGGLGLEPEYTDYLQALLRVLGQVHRVLKPTGSLWLNLGDGYREKSLLGIPWRVAIALTEQQGWVLRNDIIWHKVKGGPDNARDKLRNVHEHLFHLVKQRKGYYYDDRAVRRRPREARVVNGAVVSATGVSGVRYQRQIQLSTALSPEERQQALAALREVLAEVAEGRLADFRLVLRRQQRATHSDSGQVSGRARELQQRGFYFLKYHPDGSKLGDVWDILPEDTQGRSGHFAPYPEELCRIPILATCPPDGVVLDPFVGTGTTCLVAARLQRQSVGIDLAPEYLRVAAQRFEAVLP